MPWEDHQETFTRLNGEKGIFVTEQFLEMQRVENQDKEREKER
jgi:hypothetical protein